MTDLSTQLVEDIAAGNYDGAIRTLALLSGQAGSLEICTRETLDTLKKARELAIAQRSHIMSRLRAVEASRLYNASTEPRASWQLDG